MKRIAFFVHYDMHNIVDPYVEYYLSELIKYIDKLIIISHSDLNLDNQKILKKYSNTLYIKENHGFDFGGWQFAINKYGYDNLAEFDEVIIVNDSCYGPIVPLATLFNTIETKKCDFWGLTDHGIKDGIDTDKYHLQSYFICFRKKVFTSKCFFAFFTQLKLTSTIEEAVIQNEIMLTQTLLENGFKHYAYFANKNIANNQYATDNMSIFNPLILLKLGFPFIKRKIFEHTSIELRQSLIEYIKSNNFELYKLIINHINRILSPSNQLLVADKYLIYDREQNCHIQASISLAVHVHLYYIEMKEKIFNYLKNISIPFDLLVTVITNDDKKEATLYLENLRAQLKLKELKIKTIKNRGRNISALLIPFSKDILNYDVVCHLHTKKTPQSNFGEIWNNYLYHNLLGNRDIINSILTQFTVQKNLGILFPPIISSYYPAFYHLWGQNKEKAHQLKKHLNIKTFPREDLQFPIAPYGCMFWFKPDALKPLFNHFSFNDFEMEPWPEDGQLGHVIERIFVSVAISQGYEFKYALDKDSLIKQYVNLEWYLNNEKASILNNTVSFGTTQQEQITRTTNIIIQPGIKQSIKILIKSLVHAFVSRFPKLANFVRPLYKRCKSVLNY